MTDAQQTNAQRAADQEIADRWVYTRPDSAGDPRYTVGVCWVLDADGVECMWTTEPEWYPANAESQVVAHIRGAHPEEIR